MQANTKQRVEALQEYIAGGRILEALNEFYAADVSMQENVEPPTLGLAANIEREKSFLDSVAEWKGFQVLGMAVEGDLAFVESTMDFVSKDGTEVHYAQVSRTRWRGGKIVEERFYHG